MIKHTIKCPRCSDSRKKSETKTCSVLSFPSGTSYKCFHCGDKWFDFGSVDLSNEESAPIKDDHEALVIDPIAFPYDNPEHIFYQYKDVNHDIRLIVVRIETIAHKKFMQFILTEDGWMAKGCGLQLYYCPRGFTNSDKILVVEGEKSAIAASQYFPNIDVVTWRGGASNYKSLPVQLLDGKEVTLWPDNDKPGVDAMLGLQQILKPRSIRFINTSELPAKADLADSIPKETIARLLKEAVPRSLIVGKSKHDLLLNINKPTPFYKLGYKQTDTILSYPESGLVTILGRTNHGKSLVMVNLALNLLKQHPDTKVIYLSYELSADEMALRLINSGHGAEYSSNLTVHNSVLLEKINNGEIDVDEILFKYIDSGRFVLEDEQISLDTIIKEFNIAKLSNTKLFLFIDYIQLIPTDTQSNRYLEIKRIVETLRAAANSTGAVIIAGSQITEGEHPLQDQAREGKDIVMTSSLVLKVWNKLAARAQGCVKVKKTKDGGEEQVDYFNNVPGDIVLTVTKSRQGGLGKSFGFNLVNGNKMKEVTTNEGDF